MGWIVKNQQISGDDKLLWHQRIWCQFVNIFISEYERKGKDRFYLTTHSTHFIYGYMASDKW